MKPTNYRAGIQRFVAVEVPFRESCLASPVGGLFRPLGGLEDHSNMEIVIEIGDADQKALIGGEIEALLKGVQGFDPSLINKVIIPVDFQETVNVYCPTRFEKKGGGN